MPDPVHAWNRQAFPPHHTPSGLNARRATVTTVGIPWAPLSGEPVKLLPTPAFHCPLGDSVSHGNRDSRSANAPSPLSRQRFGTATAVSAHSSPRALPSEISRSPPSSQRPARTVPVGVAVMAYSRLRQNNMKPVPRQSSEQPSSPGSYSPGNALRRRHIPGIQPFTIRTRPKSFPRSRCTRFLSGAALLPNAPA